MTSVIPLMLILCTCDLIRVLGWEVRGGIAAGMSGFG